MYLNGDGILVRLAQHLFMHVVERSAGVLYRCVTENGSLNHGIQLEVHLNVIRGY